MRDVIPYIFWPWLLISCTILLRRRVGGGSWRTSTSDETAAPTETAQPVEFPPPADFAPVERSTDAAETAPAPADAPPARTLAEALGGIAMPCDLSPLMGSGPLDPRQVAFSTTGFEPAALGTSIADELERLGFQITPESERSILAERGKDAVRAKILSAVLDSEAVMAELHPSAPEGALVVELKLT